MTEGPRDAEYRREVRAFIAEHAPAGEYLDGVRSPRTDQEERAIRAWLARLYEAGHLGGGWPTEWGGRPDHRPQRDLIVQEELIRARSYRPLEQVMLASQALLAFGTDAQKRHHLPRIRTGEHIWCQLFSEPDAGSDLAALRTRARPDGDGFVVTGQKTWSTDAHWADMGLLLARTDPEVDRHAGLTAFLVPMDAEGITVRPVREMTGHAEFCEVFLDDVRLAHGDVLGEVDAGWTVTTTGLTGERAQVGANAVQLEMLHADLVELARWARFPDGTLAIDHEDVQQTLAETFVDVETANLIVRDTVDRAERGDDHPTDGPVAKLAYTETNVALCETALGLLASAEAIDEPGLAAVERWYAHFLWSRALTISGGSSEIVRGIVGRGLLGLPRA